MINPSLVLQQKSEIERVILDDGAVLKIHDKIHVMNYTALEIFDLCDGRRSVGEIVKEMESRYPENEVGESVQTCISLLSDSGLVHE